MNALVDTYYERLLWEEEVMKMAKKRIVRKLKELGIAVAICVISVACACL